MKAYRWVSEQVATDMSELPTKMADFFTQAEEPFNEIPTTGPLFPRNSPSFATSDPSSPRNGLSSITSPSSPTTSPSSPTSGPTSPRSAPYSSPQTSPASSVSSYTLDSNGSDKDDKSPDRSKRQYEQSSKISRKKRPYSRARRQSQIVAWAHPAHSSVMPSFPNVGQTAIDKETALTALLAILWDAELVELYCMAIADELIGAERLQRNLRRPLKRFAKNLRWEAAEGLQKSTSHFVMRQARCVAQIIVKRHREYTTASPPQHKLTRRSHLLGTAAYEESLPKNVPNFITFLIHSAAFDVSKERLSVFVLPIEVDRLDPSDRADMVTSDRWYTLSSMRLLLRSTLVAAEVLEPPLQPGLVRLRWQCVSPFQRVPLHTDIQLRFA